MNRKTKVRALSLESLDSRLCLASGVFSAGMGEMPFGDHGSHWHNSAKPHDVNQDQNVTPMDALLIINALNRGGARALSEAEGESGGLVDVNGDSQITPVDCLSVVNELNQMSPGEAEAMEATNDDSSVDETLPDDGTIDDGTIGHQGRGPRGSMISDLFTLADGNEDGALTEDELPQELWERLSSADTDGDGSLTLDELSAALCEQNPQGPGHQGNGGGLRDGGGLVRFDGNEDGLLTEDELPAQIWQHISPADTDGDSAISSDELAAYQPTPLSLEDRFSQLDEDADGLLTEDELPQEVWGRLSVADTDGDGAVSLDEFVAHVPDSTLHDGFFARLGRDENDGEFANGLPPHQGGRPADAGKAQGGSSAATELAGTAHRRSARGGAGRGLSMAAGGNTRRF